MRTALALLVLVPASGCLASPPEDPQEPGEPGPTDAEAAVTKTVELGRDSKSTPGPGTHTFTVTVPEGGATNVRWTLTIEGPSSATSTVGGNGCSNDGNVNVVVGVGATSTRSGSCSDLPAGPAEFTVTLTDPAVGYTAVIDGRVTL